MKRFSQFLLISIIFTTVLHFNCDSQTVAYVGNGGDWHNWDIYSYDIGTSTETRLTTNPAIDNHPVISHYDPNRVAWSSDRGNGEFDIYVGDINDLDGTAARLTFDDYPGVVGQGPYPDRHPHWHPNGQLIIFSSKNKFFEYLVVPTTTCSQPEIKRKFYERMNVIKLNAPGTGVVSYTELDVRTAWDQTNFPDIWVTTPDTYCGHPSFNHLGTEITFAGSTDGDGKIWEIFIVGFDPIGLSLLPNSLQRVTLGPDPIGNPIKMSGGPAFSWNDDLILFNSTRLGKGNSQIYAVPATSNDISVCNATQLTHHRGNDYIADPLNANGDFLVTSDLGPGDNCYDCTTGLNPPGWGPTPDLDVVLIANNERTTLGNESADEMLLIADEVSWFCGLKPNLASCTCYPRIFNLDALFCEAHPWEVLPPDILAGYGPDYTTNGQVLYQTGWSNAQTGLQNRAPDILANLLADFNTLWATNPPVPFCCADPILLQIWLDATEVLRRKKYVIPVCMNSSGASGLESTSFIIDYLNHIVVPSGCTFYHHDCQALYTSGPPPGFYSGTGQWGSFTVQSGGSANLTSDGDIGLLPGTIIEYGGHFSASITSTPPICCPSGPILPPLTLALVEESPGNYSNPQLRFKIYPNPATKSFWIELLDEEGACHVKIEVYNFTGHRLFHQDRKMVKRTEISLPDQLPGPYLVKVTKDNLSGSQTVILN